MCGILGIVGAHRDIARGLELMRRRGPDGRGLWHDDQIALGHIRLSIIDPTAAGHQPMVSPDGRVVMVYNGELYNFRELRAELERAGETFIGHSDSEVLLRLFARTGSECFARLNGIFAAAFWERDSSTLTMVRDPIGVKPLYYMAGENGSIAFASEMKALLRTANAPPQVDPAALLAHITYLWSPGTRTIARGVSKLLPGHVLRLRMGQEPTTWRYRDTAPPPGVPQPISADDAAALVGKTIDEAVQRQMVADVPVGSFLSGGLDSSAIVAFASRHCVPRRLQCFTIDMEGDGTAAEGFADDLPYARRVAEHLGVDLHIVRAGADMADRLAEMVYLLDEPTADPAAINSLMISELARAQGIKVLLSGAGGDDVFSGYRRHRALAAERWWAALPSSIRRAGGSIGAKLPPANNMLRRAAKALRYAGLDLDHRLVSYFFWQAPEQSLELLSPQTRLEMDAECVYAPMFDTLGNLAPGVVPLERMLYLERHHFLADHNLNYTDKTGMAAGVEVRVPLLDMEVTEMAHRLPVDFKQHGNTGKWIFKRAMEPYLPRDVIYRPKSGFGVPLRNWARGPLKPLFDDILSPVRISARGLFDPVAVAGLMARDRSGAVDATYPIFAIVCAELWCRQYIDGHYAIDMSI